MKKKTLTKDCLGKRFGIVTVVKILEKHKPNRAAIILYKCDCGVEKEVQLASLIRGHTKSCGCLKKYHGVIHGMSKTTEYRIWTNMISRCYNPNANHYDCYGGRGIKVCEKWKKSFEDFFEDMGKRPTMDLTLDRVDNDGNYEKSNCKWSTKKEQSNNTRMGIFYFYENSWNNIAQIARKNNVLPGSLWLRISKFKMEIHEAVKHCVNYQKTKSSHAHAE